MAQPGRHRHQAPVHQRRLGALGAGGHLAGPSPLRARPAGHDVRQPALDHSPVRRLLHRRGVQPLLSGQSGRRAKGALRRLRLGDPPGLRLGPPEGGRRCRQGRGGHRLGRGHEDSLRWHSPRSNVRLHDHERRRAAGDGRLHRRRRGAGGRPGGAVRHHSERHPEGIHGAQHLHLSAQGEHAHRRRHHRPCRGAHAAVQLHLHIRLPHAGGRRQPGPGAGLHLGGRRGVRAGGAGHRHRDRQVRTAPVVLLLHRHELLHGGGEAAGGAHPLGRADGAVQAHQPDVLDAAHTLPDFRRLAAGAGSLQQRGAHHHRGVGRSARRHPEPAHQRLRRGHRPADALLGAHRPQHANHHRRGVRRNAHRGPLGRQLLRGEPHRVHRPRGAPAHSGSGGDGRHDQGRCRGHAKAAH